MNIYFTSLDKDPVSLALLLWMIAKTFTSSDFIRWYLPSQQNIPFVVKTVTYEITFIKGKR